jgi:hypothetical protein
MDIGQLVFGNLISILVLALVGAGVMKIFQVASSINDVKGLLTDIKRNTQGDAPAHIATPFSYERSAEELMRAVNAEVDHPVSDPH